MENAKLRRYPDESGFRNFYFLFLISVSYYITRPLLTRSVLSFTAASGSMSVEVLIAIENGEAALSKRSASKGLALSPAFGGFYIFDF